MSEIRATTISDAAGTGPITLTGQSAAKAWLNMNGQGTIAIRDSLNVSSITDVTVGYFGHAYTSSFSSQNYCTQGTCVDLWYGSMLSPTALQLSSGYNFYTHGQNQTLYDPVYAGVASTGDLA